MFYTIYKITNKINGNFYIGKHKTKNLDDGYMGSGKLIKAAIKKHGKENFTKQTLETFNTEEEMDAAEARLVVLGEGSYNICPGGQGGWGYINSHIMTDELRSKLGYLGGFANPTPEILNKVKEGASKGGKNTAEKIKAGLIDTSLYISMGFKGKTHSIDSKEKISVKNSLSQKGIKNSQFGTIWITDGFLSKKIKKDQDIPIGWYRGRNQK